MAIQTISQLKLWFRTALKPTQQQFWDWLDSFRHRSEKIGIDDLSPDLQNTFFPHSYRQVTTPQDIAINSTDEYVIKSFDGPAGNYTFTLPAANSVMPGKVIVVGDDNGNFIAQYGIIVACAAGDNINGADVTPVFYTPKFQSAFVSDGINGWHYDAATLKLTGASGNLDMGAHDVSANNINAAGSISAPNYYFPGSYAHLTPYGLETTNDWQLANVGGDGGVPAFVYRHSDGRMTFYGPQKFGYHANSDVTKFVKLDADGNVTNAQVQYSDIAGTPSAGEDPSLKQNDLTNPDSSHYPTTNAVATALATKADLVNGKVPLAQINDALIGNVHYKGLYSFSTGLISSDDSALNGQPLPTAASGNAGWYFIAQDSGTISGTDFILGDWLISNGALGWHKVDNTDAVSSVNGYTGNVSLTKADIGLSNVPNSDATNPANIVQTATYRFVSDTEKATWNGKQAPATTLAGYGITDGFFVNGKSGGQSGYGGTAASDNLTFNSTSNPNKGYIKFSNLLTFDETTGFLLFGTNAVPKNSFQVVQESAISRIVSETYSATASSGGNLTVIKGRGTYAAPTALQSGDRMGQVNFIGHDGTGTEPAISASIEAYTDEVFTNAAHGSHLAFYTSSLGSISRTERMRISPAGFVGIGVTNPSAQLTIGGNVSAAAWTTAGIAARIVSATYTDTSSASGTVATIAATAIGTPTFAASNTGVTYTNAATLYLANAPAAGTNVTLTNTFALYVAAGQSAFLGGLSTGGGTGIGTGANLLVQGGTTFTFNTSSASALFAGAASVHGRVVINGSTASSLVLNTSYANLLIGSSPISTAVSGTHAIVANMVVNPVGTITNAGATVTTTASLYVSGAGSGGGNNYALYVAGGTAYFASTLQALQHQAISQSADPTTSNIAAGTYQVYKNTTSGVVKLWYNDGGTLKSVSLT